MMSAAIRNAAIVLRKERSRCFCGRERKRAPDVLAILSDSACPRDFVFSSRYLLIGACTWICVFVFFAKNSDGGGQANKRKYEK